MGVLVSCPVFLRQEHPKSRDKNEGAGRKRKQCPRRVFTLWPPRALEDLAISSTIRGRWLPASPFFVLRDVHPPAKYEKKNTEHWWSLQTWRCTSRSHVARTRLGPGLASTISESISSQNVFRQHYVFRHVGWIGSNVFRVVLFRIVRYMARDSNHAFHHFWFVCVCAIHVRHVVLLPWWGEGSGLVVVGLAVVRSLGACRGTMKRKKGKKGETWDG